GKGEAEKTGKENTEKAAKEGEKSGDQKGARDRRGERSGEVVRQAGGEAFREREKAEEKKASGAEKVAGAGKTPGSEGHRAGREAEEAAGSAGGTGSKMAEGGREGQAFRELTARWAGFLENLKKKDPPLYSFLAYGWPQQLRDGTLSIAFEKEHELYKQYLEGKLREISFALNSFFLQQWQVRLVSGERPPEADFSLRNKELKTGEALSLFGVLEEVKEEE
ncbi:MAG: hypothetical protein AB1652_11385, partial [Bacillota bacterium]